MEDSKMNCFKLIFLCMSCCILLSGCKGTGILMMPSKDDPVNNKFKCSSAFLSGYWIGKYEKSKIEITSDILLADNPFSIEQQIAVFRVFQEIFMNIRQHAQASRVSVSIRRSESRVFFGVQDNGIGFDIEEIKSMPAAERGLGLAVAEERVKMMDGDFEIDSRAGAGTRIAFQIPVAALQ